jgi:hypothetical protein
MAQKCPSCGAEVPPQNPFCGTCGAKVDAAPAQGPGGGEAGGGPRTLGQLVRQVVKGMVTGFVKNLPMTIAVMAVVTVIHTYLLVVVNEGFAGGDPLLGLILVLQGNELPVAIFWLLAGTLGFAAVCQVRKKRLAGTLGSVGQIPAIFRGSFDGSKPLTLSVLLFGAAFMVAVMSWLGNVLVGIQLAIVLLGALIAQGESLTAMALRLGYSDFKKNRGQQQALQPFLDRSRHRRVPGGNGPRPPAEPGRYDRSDSGHRAGRRRVPDDREERRATAGGPPPPLLRSRLRRDGRCAGARR